MYEDFIKDRLVRLRTQKGVSARDMSLSLGQNNSYISAIELGRSLPSFQGFFYICEYLGVTPSEFFDEGTDYPVEIREIVDGLKTLDAATLEDVKNIVKRLSEKK